MTWHVPHLKAFAAQKTLGNLAPASSSRCDKGIDFSEGLGLGLEWMRHKAWLNFIALHLATIWPWIHPITTVNKSPRWAQWEDHPPEQGEPAWNWNRATQIGTWTHGLFFLEWCSDFYLFIYFWLCWVFVSVRGLSPVAASDGHSSSRCVGLSLSPPLLLQGTGSRRAGSVVVAHGPSCSAACGIFPDQGSNPCPLHWQADSQPLRHQGSPRTHGLLIEITHLVSRLNEAHVLEVSWQKEFSERQSDT